MTMGRPETPSSAAAVEDALREIERPTAAYISVGEEPFWARLYCRVWPHRLLPAAVAMPIASLAGRIAMHRPGPRDQALSRAYSMTRSTDVAVLRRFARVHLSEYRMQDEIFWRPWLDRRMRIEGIERLDHARQAGRGVIVAGLHFGPMAALQHALAMRLAEDDVRFYIARWDKIKPGHVTSSSRGRYLPAKVARLEAAGARFVGRGGTYPVFRELLQRGETCWLAIDTAATKRGRVEQFVNRPVRFATGLVALALETGATIIPAHAFRDGQRPAARLLEPIVAGQFEDADALHAHLVATASAVVEERPTEIMPDLTVAMDWGKVESTDDRR
jgi:lauroyl/myristoyl acyltransferase